ncbi:MULTISPECIES: histidine phosphatase family protein [unclassified Shewanella]|uniref:histidine phosphatase family protein n=1 Tax=unclassified Shewanella TaxID=196818 RepID=UPI001C7CBAAF|nr:MULTISPECIES: histidine phosphatase family protein [unclassified Shewanella]
MQTTRVILLRHGECKGGNILRGQIDVALTEQGELQMQSVLRGLECSSFVPNFVLSSPLIRCANIAEEFALTQGLSYSTNAAFKELDFGDWDGQTFDALYQSHAEELDAYWANPWAVAPPNGESMQAFESRIDKAWQVMLEAYKGQCVLLVTHGGVMRHLIAKALGVTQAVGFYSSLKLPYAAKAEIDVLYDENGQQFLTLHWGERRT